MDSLLCDLKGIYVSVSGPSDNISLARLATDESEFGASFFRSVIASSVPVSAKITDATSRAG
jgi:hypothetical protein